MSLRKLFLALGLLLLVGVWGACVDIPSGPGTDVTLNFRSLVRFLHAVAGGAAGDVKVDGATVANVSFGNPSAYIDIASGSRSVAFGSNPAQTISFTSEHQSTVVIYGPNGSLLLNLNEGYSNKNNAYRNKPNIRFINVATGGAASVVFRRDSVRLNTQVSNTLRTASYGTAAGYDTTQPAGPTAIYAISNGGYKTTLAGSNEVPPVTSATTGTATIDLSVDGGLVISATVRSKNSEGFFTGAHLHSGAPGTNGPILYTIPVKNQVMSFDTIRLSGDNEVPPVTTSATGKVVLSVVNDSTSTTGASYTITTVTPNSMGFFTAAHIHNAAAGVNGPVVHTISVAKQVISFPEITATGQNTTANATCNFTLYRDSLVYSIRVRRDLFDTTFTAAHFHFVSNGLIAKDIRTTSWSDTARTLAGTWKRTDATQPLTDALVDSIRLGRIYVNFHSVGRPLGLIRADLIPNDTHTNTFTGRFTGTSFHNLKDEFAAGRMYFNFHTNDNPGGEIRGQAVPDQFTTNDYTATFAGVPPDTIGALLNSGNAYINFHTNQFPLGLVRGQAQIDSTKGQYAVATQTFNFENGKMYTILAVGSGPTFQIIKLDDRQAASPTPTPPPVQEKRAEGRKQQAKSND